MIALRIVFPLALAALAAGVMIGLAGYQSPTVDCAAVFSTGSSLDSSQIRDEENERTCVLVRAGRMPWTTTLIATGLGLLVSSALLRAAPKRRAGERPAP